MLTREEDIDAHALRRQGWTISAIARHLGRDRKTIRAYLAGGRVAGERKPAEEDPFEPFVDYVRARLTEDPHLWAVTLFDEVTGLGYDRSYPTFTRQIRTRGLRPHCEPCSATKGRANAPIDHPPGEETQWDWVELPDPPAAWGLGKNAHLLVGALAHSSRWRGTLAATEEQPQLIDGLDATTRKLGGLTKKWRFDRMATVCHPELGKVTATFAAVAKHYGVQVAICPPRRGNRKGVVEKSNHTAAQRWWRTLPDDVTIEEAQASLDRWCATRGDARLRAAGPGGKASVLTIAEAEAPVTDADHAVPRHHHRGTDRVRSGPGRVAGELLLRPTRAGPRPGHRLAAARRPAPRHRHHLTWRRDRDRPPRARPDGAGVMVRDHGHVIALERLVLSGHDTSRPHRRKERIPPGPAALAAAEQLRARQSHEVTAVLSDDVVIDLAKYDRAATGRNTLT